MTKIKPIERYKLQTKRYAPTYDTTKANKENIAKNNLKGLLLNTYIKDKSENQENFSDFNEISSRLLIPENYKKPVKQEREKTESFDIKKAMKPVLIAGGVTIAAILGITYAVNKYSSAMAKDAGLVYPPAVASNNNLNQEPHFAFYQALRDPSAPKVRGFIGVGIMSIATIAGEKLIEAVKEIWTKKQNCDIEHDLQENLINVETEVFSGKLDVVNTLLKDTTEYFKEALGDKKTKNTNFKSYLSFKGKDKDDDKAKLSKKNILYIFGAIAGIVGLSFALFKNISKIHNNLNEFQKRFSDKEIRNSIAQAVELSKQENGKSSAIKKMSNILKSIKATNTQMEEELEKIQGITKDEVSAVLKDINKDKIFNEANEVMYGSVDHQQYYCYMDEVRGHLYNWLLHPQNKFNKYLFLGLSAISTTGYVLKAVADAVKDVTVGKENAKSELNLRKNLISTEIENFKAKKLSAINPLIENFDYQMKKGKSKQELKEIAENILSEIKNGPPYVYS